jgi:hypothetical protein
MAAIEVVGFILVAILLWTTTVAMTVGIIGMLTGERFERCPHCKHYGFTVCKRLHENGCPPTLRGHIAHLCDMSSQHIHFRHH